MYVIMYERGAKLYIYRIYIPMYNIFGTGQFLIKGTSRNMPLCCLNGK